MVAVILEKLNRILDKRRYLLENRIPIFEHLGPFLEHRLTLLEHQEFIRTFQAILEKVCHLLEKRASSNPDQIKKCRDYLAALKTKPYFIGQNPQAIKPGMSFEKQQLLRTG